MSLLSNEGPEQPLESKRLISKAELAKHLGVSQRTLDYWRTDLGLPCLKVRRRVFFNLHEVLEHLGKYRDQRSLRAYANA